MKTKLISLLFALVLVIGLLPLGTPPALAAETGHTHTAHEEEYTALPDGRHSYLCSSCGETVTEACDFSWYTYNDSEHWAGCLLCQNSAKRAPHTMDGCYCTEENCNFRSHLAVEWTPVEDRYCHTGYCTACESMDEEGHRDIRVHNDSEHWYVCTGCRYEDPSSRAAHSSFYFQALDAGRHSRWCNDCGFEVLLPHTDTDGDGRCDDCGEPTHLCASKNGAHICEICGYPIDGLCTDSDGDHTCDAAACGEKVTALCTDSDGDHTCDVAACARHMKEACSDTNADGLCEHCGRNCCRHFMDEEDVRKSNGDGTHIGDCVLCGETVTLPCVDYGYQYSKSAHRFRCICGYHFPVAEHSYRAGYRDGAVSLVGHWLYCDKCAFEDHLPHVYQSGVCGDCGAEETPVYEVYIGGVGLENGQYIDCSGRVSTEKPAGGYAHYEDGVLTLSDYRYRGEGTLWRWNGLSEEEQYAAVLATRDVTLLLFGESELAATGTEYDMGIFMDAVVSIGDLTVGGEGSLHILEADDGFEVVAGDLVIEGGVLSVGTADEDGAVLDDGFDVGDGDVTVKGGTVTVHSHDHGFDLAGDLFLLGGTLAVTAGDDGFNVGDSITVSGGSITVEAEDHGLDSSLGGITVTGGTVSVVTEDENGLSSGAELVIDGGTLTVRAGSYALSASLVSIRGGRLDLQGEEAILDGEVTLGDRISVKDAGGNKVGAEALSSGTHLILTGGPSVGVIVSVAVGAAVAVAAVGFLVFWLVIRRRRHGTATKE